MTAGGQIVDIVNFNADASCFANAAWLDALAGGEQSTLYRWLSIYTDLQKKVVIGFPGVTVADIARLNPECIQLINDNAAVFEIILRPFAHDIGLVRSPEGFLKNLQLGLDVIQSEFKHVTKVYLPPEFMCNSTQISVLVGLGIEAVCLYPARFEAEVARRIPIEPFEIKGILGTTVSTLPIDRAASEAYLDGIHCYNAAAWNQALHRSENRALFSWRDGESSFLLPDTIAREQAWLESEEHVTRAFLSETDLSPVNSAPVADQLESFPIHSFSAWVREMKMYWFIEKVSQLETQLSSLSSMQKSLWLQIINSDILSAVEKLSPQIDIFVGPDATEPVPYVIQRQAKAFAGEEVLHLLQNMNEPEVIEYLESSAEPHMMLVRERLAYLSNGGFDF